MSRYTLAVVSPKLTIAYLAPEAFCDSFLTLHRRHHHGITASRSVLQILRICKQRLEVAELKICIEI